MTYHLSAPSTIYEGAAGFGNVDQRPFEDTTVKVGVAAVALVCLWALYKVATEGDFEQNPIYRRSFGDPWKMSNEEYESAIEPPWEVDYDQAARLIDEMESISGHGHPCVMEKWRRGFIEHARDTLGLDVSGIDGSKSRAMGNFTLNGRRRRRRR